ncbi:site-specific DNA-methyltransferase [Acinetobacter nosocomialis]
MTKTKLELTWIGKDKRPRLEPRILLEDPSKSYHANTKVSENDIFDNKLIFGDNLLALKALEREYTGKVKCVFIDPPYNTGSAFEYYDDGLEHSIWLGLMRDRIEIIYNLLSEDGSLWVTLDDNEIHYFKIMCDEIFGRNNFSCSIIWEKRKSRENRRAFSFKHDYVLVFAKNKFVFDKIRNPIGLTEEVLKRYKNPDEDPRGVWQSVAITAQAGHGTASQFYKITTPSGRVIEPPAGNCWRFTEKKLAELITDNRIYFGLDGNNVPRQKKFLSESNDTGLTPETIWYADDVSTNDQAKRHSNILFDGKGFDSPKPEELLERIIHIATNEDDLVLDSFAGSGTTGAVAQKMGRRWIMVELGEHCHTHIIPRLQKVIDGEDKGGVTESTGWQGGGGFRYYKLAPSLMKKDQWDNWVINPEYNQEMLVEAMCKLEGYTYTPSETEYWNHGKGSETDFIYVTTQTLTDQQLQAISEEVGEGRTLLIIASAWRSKNIDRFINLTLKKIPNSIIKACEWGHDDYSLNVQNLPMSEPDIEEKPKARKVKNTQEQSQVTGDLFGDQT